MIETNYKDTEPEVGDVVTIVRSLVTKNVGRTAIVQEDFKSCGYILITGTNTPILIGKKRLYKISL